jgi:hypothetical protein
LATVELPTLARAEVDTLLHLLDTLAVEQQALQWSCPVSVDSLVS